MMRDRILYIGLSGLAGSGKDTVAKALSVTVGNLYNIKRRAMAAFADVALKDKRQYEQR